MIDIKKVNKKYGEQTALKDVSFSVNKGEIVGFIGPNGAGKSTMMKIICGYMPPDGGEVFVFGYNALTEPQKIRKKIGYLPEHNPLYEEMYIYEYLKYVYKLYHKSAECDKKVLDIIRQAGLHSESHKRISELSKGYKQRTGIAQALIHEPEILILDEPTSGLDPNQIIEIRNLIQRMGKNKTVLLSTHIMQEVEAICDRVIIINKGEIIANEKTEVIKGLLKETTQIIDIEFSEEISAETLLSVEGIDRVEKTGLNKYVAYSNRNEDIRNKLFQLAVERGITVLTLQKRERNLEEVFHNLTMGIK